MLMSKKGNNLVISLTRLLGACRVVHMMKVMQYHIRLRSEPYGRWGYTIEDGHGAKVAGRGGCRSLERAENLARAEAERLIATDRALGRRSHVASGAVIRERAYAWADPYDGLWRVGDRDNAGTHRPGVSRACAEYEAGRANERNGNE